MMDTPKIFDSELKFCEILWTHEPVKSSELVRLCADELGWKKSTTYTVIKRLTERGVVHTENAVVTALVNREDVQSAESRAFVERVRTPCWMALSRLLMAVSASRSCCSYSGTFTLSLSCKSMSMDTMASIALSSMTIFMVSPTTKSSIHSFLTGFLWHSVRFFLTDTHL